MQLNGWDHALKVTADGSPPPGSAGAILLRKAADQLGLTAGLSAALRRKGSSPLLDRGMVLAWPPVFTLVIGHKAERGIGMVSPPGATGAAVDILRQVLLECGKERRLADFTEDFLQETSIKILSYRSLDAQNQLSPVLR